MKSNKNLLSDGPNGVFHGKSELIVDIIFIPLFIAGVSHDDDVYIVLENNYINPTTTIKDRAMLHDMLNFWESFASTG